MDLKSLLNQALSSDIVKKGSEQLKTLGQDKSQLGTLGAGALGGGLLGMLLGSKKSKKWGKSALKVGGAAALVRSPIRSTTIGMLIRRGIQHRHLLTKTTLAMS